MAQLTVIPSGDAIRLMLAEVLILYNALSAEYVSVPCSEVLFSSTDRPRAISSYNYPFSYQDLLNCTYYVYTETSDVTGSGVVCFRFRRFDLELHRDLLTVYENGRSFVYSGGGQATQNYTEPHRKHVWDENFCFQSTSNILKLVFTSDKTSTRRGFYATFWTQSPNSTELQDNDATCLQSADDTIPPNTTAPCFDAGQWTCFNRGCVSTSALCDLSNSCGDWSDEQYVHAKCTTGSYGPSIYGCDFDHGHGCGLIGLANPGWFLDHKSSHVNPDPDRLPSSDHTVGPYSANMGDQFYVRTVFGDVIDDIHRLGLTDTRVTLDQNQTYCLSFWYHMTGPRVGRLRVILQPEVDRPIWSRTANYSARWLHGQVVINHLVSEAQVFFEGIRSHDYNATFALDDIHLSNDEPCYTDDISCNFEFHFCGWTNEDNTFVRLTKHDTPSRSVGDPVSSSGDEYYAAVWSDGVLRAKLTSPIWSRFVNGSSGACLQFWIYSSSASGRFQVWTVNIDGERLSMGELKPEAKLGAGRHAWMVGRWKEVTLDLWSALPFKIEIEAVINRSNREDSVYLALDELVVIEDGCHMIELQSCPIDMFRCTGSNDCVDMFRMCDGYNDCPNNSDEDLAACCYINKCPPDYFCCRNGNCVWSAAVCDGYNNCSDWTDERYCPFECHSNQFACRDVNMCISRDYKCNGHKDCPDGSDENNCFGYVHPAVLTIVIAVVIIVVIVIVVRATLCIRKRSGCRSGADRVQPASAGVQEREDAYSEIGVYQQPPEYQECVNNPAYRKPVRDEYCAKAEECTSRDVRPPPSYDKVEEGEYETLTVPEKHAMARLKREIMNRFRCSSPSPEVSCATAVDGAEQLEQAEFSGQVVRDHRAQHGARPADGRGARKLGKDNRGFEAPMGDCPGPLTRTASNLSRSSSIPKYNDLVHPPTYDNLSFCADRRDDVVNLPSDVTSEANISRDERIAIPEAQARERSDVVTDISSLGAPPVTIAEETTTNEMNPEDPEYRESEFHPRSVAERVLVEPSLNGQQRYILAKFHSCGDLPTTTNPDVSSRDSSESANPEPQWRHLVTTSDEQQVPFARSGSEAQLSPGCKQFSCQGRIRSMPCLGPGSCGRCAPNELVLDACSLGHQTRDRGTLNERCSNSRLSILPSSDSVV